MKQRKVESLSVNGKECTILRNRWNHVHWFNDTIKIIFFLSGLLSVEDKSSLSETTAIEVQTAKSCSIILRRHRAVGALNFAEWHFKNLAWLWLSVIKALNTLKLFYRREYWLPSEIKIKMSQRSLIDSLRRSVQFAFLRRFFLQYVTSLITTQPTATCISAVRW